MSGEKPVPGRPAEANTTDFAGRTKDDGRSARLSFRNFAEHGMRREFKDKALQTCSSYVKAFAECAEEKGLLVVWSCRGAIGELLIACIHLVVFSIRARYARHTHHVGPR